MTDSTQRILFISPARRRLPGEDFVFDLGFLNLPYLAAVTPPGYQLEIIDEEHRPINFEAPARLVALTAQTPVAPRAYEIADAFRARGVPVVMGGVHASTLPEEALAHVDAVVVGEGEFVWPELLADLERGGLRRIYRGGTDRDLAGLPPPRRDLLDARHYLPLTLVETTRGCPHRCDFCGVSRFFGHRYRKRPAAEVEAELRGLFGAGFRHRASRWLARLGLDLPYFLERRLVYFIDSNFCADRGYCLRIMETLEAMDVLWWCHATVDIARDEELLGRMARSGCIAVNIGFESLSPENLAAMRKSFAGRFDYAEAVRRLHAHGIGVMGTFVVGFDGEDAGIFRRVEAFVRENRLDWALAFIRTPYPGTRLFEEMEAAGRIRHRDWERYDTLNCVFTPQGMTVEELEQGLRALWRRIFSLASIRDRILRGPRVHPLFYLGMNLQFHAMTRRWRPAFDPFGGGA
ncbi:B12-binding domain-containing radical SAM protein [Dissulfurirhabdus thermomarina]|uniref:B12-binding domain-containing radical SAM protein n=1 Tax=Dissulfurirhabdus thermomarina TaxID=1765737 RepID=A0A6N9TQJ6_DISTH|nr:radical SAM protein [Dissulfurirhabdus thermomarina]NDY43328.1 B12-binding domain-containing radical SAM protein [Dissulfurirhabdus thermomarina]NMX23774.1 B12-binding domain-containing radical SAM protein [Dissulfurirhabdus thermomarina]